MAKVTQIDYQNALYDIEDADAQSKISDLQTAVANTYTKTQVDTKFDNYYDKNQVNQRVNNLQSEITNCYTKQETDIKFNEYYTKSEIDTQQSAVQSALDNRYTKSEVNTKLNSYYTKSQADGRYQRFPNLSSKSTKTLKGYGSNPTTFTPASSGIGIFYCWLAGGYSPNNATIKINNVELCQLFASSDVSDTFSFPIKAGDVVTCSVPSSGLQSTFVGLNFFPFS